MKKIISIGDFSAFWALGSEETCIADEYLDGVSDTNPGSPLCL